MILKKYISNKDIYYMVIYISQLINIYKIDKVDNYNIYFKFLI